MCYFSFIYHSVMSSITVTLSGNSSILEAEFFPPITLDKKFQYECGLVDLKTFNSIPNVDETNNSFSFGIERGKTDEQSEYNEKQFIQFNDSCYKRKNIFLPTGSYEIIDIFNYIKTSLKTIEPLDFSVHLNKNTLKCQIRSNLLIDFTQSNTIGSVLGYSSRLLEPNKMHESDNRIDINRINTIRVECSIITNSYFNNESVHTLHEFYPQVEAGYKIVESPLNVIYLPVTVHTIHTLSLKFVDQNNRLINFRGEDIVTRLHIRRVRS